MGKMIETMEEVINKEHPFWHEVYANLLHAYYEEGCNHHSHELSRKILTLFPNVDVEGTINFYKENGGHCDCKVINIIYDEIDPRPPKPYIIATEFMEELYYLYKRNDYLTMIGDSMDGSIFEHFPSGQRYNVVIEVKEINNDEDNKAIDDWVQSQKENG